MEKDLLGKEVLCILDTRQIQRFVFRSNSYIDVIGGSDLLTHILDDAIKYALHHIDSPLGEDEYDLSMDPNVEKIPYFVSERIQFQLIICTAGNALFIARTGELCQKIIRKVSRYYLDHGYSLNLATSVTEKTKNLGSDIFRLYQRLNAMKASCDISDPLESLPVVIREKNTGEPAVYLDEKTGEYYSLSSAIRRREAGKRKTVVDLKKMKTYPGIDGKEYRAVLHIDGNNLGITIGKILQDTESYEEGIRARRRINRNISGMFRRTLEKTLCQLEEEYAAHYGKEADFSSRFYVIHNAGDDINCACSAELAIPFLNRFYQNMEGSALWDEPGLVIPLYACAGIAFVTPRISFHEAFHLAEACCSSAKSRAKEEKNLRNGLAGNWIDYQVRDQDNAQELSLLRRQSYITGERIDLLLRPYSLNPQDQGEAYSYGKLLERAARIHGLPRDEQRDKLLRQSYGMGRLEFKRWIDQMDREGLDLTELLGNPLFEDREKNRHATWFDATELSPFVPWM